MSDQETLMAKGTGKVLLGDIDPQIAVWMNETRKMFPEKQYPTEYVVRMRQQPGYPEKLARFMSQGREEWEVVMMLEIVYDRLSKLEDELKRLLAAAGLAGAAVTADYADKKFISVKLDESILMSQQFATIELPDAFEGCQVYYSTYVR